jgi:SAM-dependent methyltransferase
VDRSRGVATVEAIPPPLEKAKSATRSLGSRARERVRLWRARGDSVECPCCSHTWAAMQPYNGRANAQCPGCGSLERHRILWLFLLREIDILKGSRSVLHMAPEPALVPLLRRPNISYVSGDLEPGQAMEVMDVTSLPQADGVFDVVICNHVLEHIPDDRRAMCELRRVLKPGGFAIMQHPIDMSRAETYEDRDITTPQERLREFGQADHMRLYGRDFGDRLAAAGFEVTIRRYLDELDPAERVRYALGDSADDGMRRADVYCCVAAISRGSTPRSSAASAPSP